MNLMMILKAGSESTRFLVEKIEMIKSTKSKIKNVLNDVVKELSKSTDKKDQLLAYTAQHKSEHVYIESWAISAVKNDFPKILERMKKEADTNLNAEKIVQDINDIYVIVNNGGFDEVSEDDEESLINQYVKRMIKEINEWLLSENVLFHLEPELHYSPYEYDEHGGITRVTVKLIPRWNNDAHLNKCKTSVIRKKMWNCIENICLKYHMSLLECESSWCTCYLQEFNDKIYDVVPHLDRRFKTK